MRLPCAVAVATALALQAQGASALLPQPSATSLGRGVWCRQCHQQQQQRQQGTRRGMVMQRRGGGGGDNGGGKKKDKEMDKALRTFQVMEQRKEKKKERKKEMRESAPPPGPPRHGKRDNPLRPAAAPAATARKKPPSSPFLPEAAATATFNVGSLTGVQFIGGYGEDADAWPQENVPEVAFLGRSNVGKSSMLNCLFGERAAVVSKTPGRTQAINIFSARGGAGGARELCRLADLPGYGYAKLGKEDQRAIGSFLLRYLQERRQLKLLILLVDTRRGPLAVDAEILDFAATADVGFRVLVVATKVDKLSAPEAEGSLARIRQDFGLPEGLPLPFSAVTGRGRRELWQYIREACVMDTR